MSSSNHYIASLQVTGRGNNLGPDGSIVVDAGFDTDAYLEGAVMIKVAHSLKNCKIQIDFKGICETRWEFGGKLAVKPESENYKVFPHHKTFQHLTETLYDSKEPILPNPIGGAVAYPFKFHLPRKDMPPSYSSVSGKVEYILRASVSYQEPAKFMKTTQDFDFPVIVSMPDAAKVRLLHSSSAETVNVPGTQEKCGFSVSIPKRIVEPGDSLAVDITINSTPGNTRLRMMNASLKSLVLYTNKEGKESASKAPRPLSEMSQSFPLVKVGGVGGEAPIATRIYLLVDPDLAKPSIDAPLIKVQTVFKFSMIVDNSELNNVVCEIPIVVVPHMADAMHSPTGLSPMHLSEGRSRISAGHSPRTVSIGSLDSPTLQHYQNSIASQRAYSINSISLPEARLPYARNSSMPLPGKDVAHMMNGMELNDGGQVYRKASLLHQSPGTEYFSDNDSIRSTESIPNEGWSVQMVAAWVAALGGTEDVVQSFIDNGIDGTILLGLTMDDLKDELGIASFGLRRKMAHALAL
ncbi:hypothetical protein BCR33DRAFT_714537 [Rhizoclosmatium globosum]|uniref:SAM domain-containing protein n=1 Tax=Rhizoclosmatium globosum TaxID=329046 RepID=A0A1Y2CMC6_9FUNG|nr:hypothetical protein BCR33DRAFT_714537 [Rhizoclosmatium globosum]|eukprot:ORY48107.1 hypothetical protein BCR33DRAFT_714537 [Rhizoclosmatium globosum]